MELSATLFWSWTFCPGKLSDVMYVSPWHIATRGINAELGVSHNRSSEVG